MSHVTMPCISLIWIDELINALLWSRGFLTYDWYWNICFEVSSLMIQRELGVSFNWYHSSHIPIKTINCVVVFLAQGIWPGSIIHVNENKYFFRRNLCNDNSNCKANHKDHRCVDFTVHPKPKMGKYPKQYWEKRMLVYLLFLSRVLIISPPLSACFCFWLCRAVSTFEIFRWLERSCFWRFWQVVCRNWLTAVSIISWR